MEAFLLQGADGIIVGLAALCVAGVGAGLIYLAGAFYRLAEGDR
jgi:hypothetical protein